MTKLRELTPEQIDELTVVPEEVSRPKIRRVRMRSAAQTAPPRAPTVEPARLTSKQLEAVELLAGGQSKTETSRHCGVTDRTISRWQHQEPFQQSVRNRCEQYRRQIEKQGIREQGALIGKLDQQRRLALGAIRDIGAGANMQFVLGGRTGLLKQVTVTVHGTRVVIFRVDVKRLRWLRVVEIKVAKFLGQWGRGLHREPPGRTVAVPAMSRQKELAALWFAQGEWPDKEIARRRGLHRTTVRAWKRASAHRSAPGAMGQTLPRLRHRT